MIYKSMQGKEIDMSKLISQNEMAVAVGNLKVNARGDELGPGGKVVRKREDIIRDNSKRVKAQSNIRTTTPPIEETEEKVAPPIALKKKVKDD